MKNRITSSLALLLILLWASPLMAQVAQPDSTIPHMSEPVVGQPILWGISGLFTLLVLLIAFKNPKRNFYDPKA